MALLPFQEDPCRHLVRVLREKGSALDASDTGVGKTYVAVHAAKELGIPVGIVCPKSVIPSWERVCASEGLQPVFILNYEKLVRGATAFVMKDKRAFLWNFKGLLIWDEVHKCKSMNSLNSRLLIAAWKTGYIRCLLLSATAARNPVEMRATGFTLGLHKGYDWWHWLFNYGAKKNRWNGVQWNGTQAQLAAIHQQIFPARGVRLRVKDLGAEFPDNKIIAEAISIGDEGELDRVYSEARKALDELKLKQENDFPSAMTIILRARQKAELLKVPALVEMAQDAVDEGRSVVIFCCFNQTIRLLSEYLNTKCIVWGENQTPEEREQNINDFQSDNSRIILCNVQAGGVGISLHDLRGDFPRTSLLCPTYNAVDLKQSLGRIHRSGGRSNCIQKIIYGAGSVEEAVCKRVQVKLNDIETINDGDIDDDLKWEHK